jgi:uncharacterized protein YbjQ (UPF0145 family)
MSLRSFGPFIAAAAVLATGCVHVSTTRIATPNPVASSPDSVRVFITQRPTEYTEVAVLRARRFLATDDRTLAALRREAAALGANGIVLLNAGATQVHTGTGVVITGTNKGAVVVGNGTTEVDQYERAVAIRWSRDR